MTLREQFNWQLSDEPANSRDALWATLLRITYVAIPSHAICPHNGMHTVVPRFGANGSWLFHRADHRLHRRPQRFGLKYTISSVFDCTFRWCNCRHGKRALETDMLDAADGEIEA